MKSFQPKIKKKLNHFEGWYTRIITNEFNLVIIFGYSNYFKDSHCFIQFYFSKEVKSHYFRYPIEEFYYDDENKQNNKVFIGSNFLSSKEIYIHEKKVKLQGSFSKGVFLKKYFFSKSAMCFSQFLPLPCYQEIVLMDGLVDFRFNNLSSNKKQPQRFSGKVYMEKSFGNKFPNRWYWVQCNTFRAKKNISFSFSYGKLLLFGKKINAFFSILIDGDKEYRFATYNLAKIILKKNDNSVHEIFLKSKKYLLKISIQPKKFVELIAPEKNALMNKKVFECVNGNLELNLYRGKQKEKQRILSAFGENVGFENMY